MCTTRAHLILLTRSTLGYPPICLYTLRHYDPRRGGPTFSWIVLHHIYPMQAVHTGLVMRAALWGPPTGPNGDGTWGI